MTITTSLVVDLGGGEDAGLLKAEIDAREDGFNGGDTNFLPGDSVHYLVYTGAKTKLIEQRKTLGVISSLGKRTRAADPETVVFANAREATLSYPVQSGLSVQWMGPAPGAAQLRGDNTLVLPAPGVGVATVTYTTEFEVFRLSNLPGTVNGKATYTVLIVLIGEVS